MNAGSKRLALFAVLFAAIFAATVGTGMASATPPDVVSIVNDSWSPNYAPNPVDPGGNTVLTLTVRQSAPKPRARVTIDTGTTDLLFVSNGDHSAVCTPSGTAETCTYTDFAHGYKSDSFTFQAAAGATPGETITASISVHMFGGGSASAQSTVSITPPPAPSAPAAPKGPSWTPPPYVPVHTIPYTYLCYSRWADVSIPGVWKLNVAQQLLATDPWDGINPFNPGYSRPIAIAGNPAGYKAVGNYHLVCRVPAGYTPVSPVTYVGLAGNLVNRPDVWTGPNHSDGNFSLLNFQLYAKK